MKNKFLRDTLWCGITLVLLLSYAIIGLQAGSDGEEEPPITHPTLETPEPLEDGWVYANIEYIHDVRAPNEYFLKLHDHPSGDLGVPDVYGGYQTTDVYTIVQLRGVSVPRSLHNEENRARPPNILDNERKRWDDAMNYVWNIMEPNKTFRVGNMEILQTEEKIKADIEVLLGGHWLSLANLITNDLYARKNMHGIEWDFGLKDVAPLNPNIPK